MAKELLLRKLSTSHNPLCTSYRVDQPSYRFTLQSCDEGVDATVKDGNGTIIATVEPGSPALVSRPGLYNVCINGRGAGVLYVEWTSDTYVDQQCCNEVREEFEQMLNDAIANVESKIPSATVTVRGGENAEVTKSGNTYTVNATDTVTTLKAGNGIFLQRNGYEYTVSSKVANIVAGENVSIQEGTESDGSPRFEISAVDTKPDVDKAYVDSKIAAIVDKDTITTLAAGNVNVTVVDSGVGGNHAYTISTVDTKPDVTKAYVDEQIAAIEDKDTVTTMVAGNQNVTVTDSGVGGNHVYSVSTKDTITTVKAGDNINVTKSGNEYTVTATSGGTTELVPGNNVSITDAGSGGNHKYIVNATDTVTTVKQGTNTTVTKSGNEYTVNATDTVTTVKAGTNVTVTKNGNEYTVNATGGGGGTDTVLWVSGSGSDENGDGSENNPYRQIMFAMNNIGKNGTINVANGNYSAIKLEEDKQIKLTVNGNIQITNDEEDLSAAAIEVYRGKLYFYNDPLSSKRNIVTNAKNIMTVSDDGMLIFYQNLNCTFNASNSYYEPIKINRRGYLEILCDFAINDSKNDTYIDLIGVSGNSFCSITPFGDSVTLTSVSPIRYFLTCENGSVACMGKFEIPSSVQIGILSGTSSLGRTGGVVYVSDELVNNAQTPYSTNKGGRVFIGSQS